MPWEHYWRATYGADVVATPTANTQRTWPEAAYRWAAGHRQVLELDDDLLKDLFALERHRDKTVGGLLVRVAAKVVAFTARECGSQPFTS